MSLNAFLGDDAFLHDREAMMMHQLVYDCRLVMAKLGTRLQVLSGEVDHDGFDIVFDDGEYLKRFQVKTVYGKTTSWDIHKSLLRPSPESADYLGFQDPISYGVGGGVILQKLNVTPQETIAVNYLYTDLNIIRAFDLEIIKREHVGSQRAIEGIFEALKRGPSDGKINLAEGAFLEAKGSRELLALAGFNTTDWTTWPYLLKQVSAHHLGLYMPTEARLPTDDTGRK